MTIVALPAELIGNETTAEAADHSADGEDGDGDGEDDLLPSLGDVLVVASRVRLADEILDHLDILQIVN